MKIKLQQVRHALALWRHGSFRRAAVDQGLSQPALSRSVHALEVSLGVPLFDRETAEVTLTKFGEAFVRRAEQLVTDAAELEREMNLMKALGVGHLSVAMDVCSAGMSGHAAVAELLRTHPSVRISLALRHWRDVAQMVRDRDADIGLADISQLRGAPGISTEPVGRHEVVFFCRAGHPVLARGGPLSPAVLDEYPFAGFPVSCRPCAPIPRKSNDHEAAGGMFPPVLVEDLAATCDIVAQTDAFGAASALQLEPWLTMGAVVVVPLRAPWAALEYGFIHLESRSLSPTAEAFRTLVREIEPGIGQRNRILTERLFQRLEPRA